MKGNIVKKNEEKLLWIELLSWAFKDSILLQLGRGYKFLLLSFLRFYFPKSGVNDCESALDTNIFRIMCRYT